jgi:hypothetical protein
MPGFRFKIKDLPEEADEPRILLHKLFLPAGVFFLGFGLWAGWGYLHVHPPAESELLAVRLQAVTNVAESRYSRGTGELRAVNLQLTNGTAVEYKTQWPRFESVRSLDTNLSVLVDRTNLVWGLRSGNGLILEREYFVSRNLEIKSIDALCAIMFLPFGVMFLVGFFAAEIALRKGTFPEKQRVLLRTRKLILVGFLFGYLGFYWFVLVPLLGKIMPGWSLPLVWVLSGGILGNLLVDFLKKWRPGTKRIS